MYLKLSGEKLFSYCCLYDFIKNLEQNKDLFDTMLRLFALKYKNFKDDILNCKTINDFYKIFDDKKIDIYDVLNLPYKHDFIENVLIHAKGNYFIKNVNCACYEVIKLNEITIFDESFIDKSNI